MAFAKIFELSGAGSVSLDEPFSADSIIGVLAVADDSAALDAKLYVKQPGSGAADIELMHLKVPLKTSLYVSLSPDGINVARQASGGQDLKVTFADAGVGHRVFLYIK